LASRAGTAILVGVAVGRGGSSRVERAHRGGRAELLTLNGVSQEAVRGTGLNGAVGNSSQTGNVTIT
jgi:hypothetical protein